jgi:hypothetical protein
MHGHMNVKFDNAKQAKEPYEYMNTQEKLFTTNATICSSILILLESCLYDIYHCWVYGE